MDKLLASLFGKERADGSRGKVHIRGESDRKRVKLEVDEVKVGKSLGKNGGGVKLESKVVQADSDKVKLESHKVKVEGTLKRGSSLDIGADDVKRARGRTQVSGWQSSVLKSRSPFTILLLTDSRARWARTSQRWRKAAQTAASRSQH